MGDRLYRSRAERMVCGVCGGLGAYLRVDPTLIRLAFAAATILGGSGILVYIVLCLVVPQEPFAATARDDAWAGMGTTDAGATGARPPFGTGEGEAAGPNGTAAEQHRRNAIFLGGFLVLLGLYLVLRNFGFSLVGWIPYGLLWPLLLIALGLLLIWRRARL